MLVILLACLLDYLFGDPGIPIYPANIIGKAVNFYEDKIRDVVEDEKKAGFYLTLGLPLDVLILSFFILFLASRFSPLLAFVISIFFVFSAVSVRSAATKAYEIYNLLAEGEISVARKKIGAVIGEDADDFSETEIIRATIESVACNVIDGTIAPFFYAFLGGAPLAITYRAVNILSAKIGLKTERYVNFGNSAVKLSNFANYLPARISVFFISVAAFFAGLDTKRAFFVAKRDGAKGPDPNYGFSEAAFAGALGVQLGGINFYRGLKVEKPYRGDSEKGIDLDDIPKSIRLMYLTSFIGVVALVLLQTLLLKAALGVISAEDLA